MTLLPSEEDPPGPIRELIRSAPPLYAPPVSAPRISVVPEPVPPPVPPMPPPVLGPKKSCMDPMGLEPPAPDRRLFMEEAPAMELGSMPTMLSSSELLGPP